MKGFLAFLILSLTARVAVGAPPLQEGFEGATFPPPGWTIATAGLPSPHCWHRTTDHDYRGDGRASAFVGSGSPGAIDEWLITPVVTLAVTDRTLKFSWSGSPQWSNVLDASVNIREVNETGWTSLWSIRGNESPADPFIYRQRIVDLSAWVGRRVQFGFRVFGTNGASFGLDDIVTGDFAPASLPADTSCTVGSGTRSASPWRVTGVREPWVTDVPLETRTPYLGEPTDRNYAPGPDSMVARVAIIQRRGYIDVLNLRTGDAQRLLDTPASLPMWSPDGRYISCTVWKSTVRPYELEVVDVKSRAIVTEPDAHASGMETRWSPDSREIAVSGTVHASSRSILYTVSIPGGKVTTVDSLEVPADYEFTWSPDSRWIAFSRPTQVAHEGDTIAADLWIADAATGERWCILSSPEWAQMTPLWITNRSIQVTRVRWHDEGDNEEQRVIVTLSHVTDARR